MILGLIVLSLLLVLFILLRRFSDQHRNSQGSQNSFMKFAVILLFLTLPLVGYGTRLQATSPNLEAYHQHLINRSIANNPDKDLGPGFGLGLAMASAWPFTVLMHGVGILVFITSSVFVRALTKRTNNRNVLWRTFLVFIGFWSYMIMILVRSAVESFRWDFTLLAIAHVIMSFGLIMGSIGMFKENSNKLLKRDAA